MCSFLSLLFLIAKLVLALAWHLPKCNSLAFKREQGERCSLRSGYRKQAKAGRFDAAASDNLCSFLSLALLFD